MLVLVLNALFFFNSLGKTEAVSNPWQFASGYYDATTGLYKFGTRYYSPTLGRWTQKDPLGGSVGKVGSGNAYVYVGNAPVMETDPSGAGDCLGSILTNGGSALALLITINAVAAPIIDFLLGSVIGIPFAFVLALIVGFIDVRISIYAYNLIANDCGWISVTI